MTWKVRPNALCRIAGIPASEMRSLRAPLCVELLSKVDAVDQVIRLLADELGDDLYNAVGGCEDRLIRGPMINLRRAIYRQPLAALKELSAALQRIDDSGLTPKLQLYASLLEQRHHWIDLAKRRYAEESCVGRRALARLAGDDDFRKGLLVSSRSLYGRLSGIEQSPPGDRQWLKLHRGILKYVARTAMKATPFGRFCAVIPVTTSSDPERSNPRVLLNGSPQRKRGVARISKQVCGLLLPAILRLSHVREALILELNPTVSSSEGRVEFLTTVGAREVFRSLDLVPALSATMEVVSREERSYQETLAAVVNHTSAVYASVRRFLDGLIDCGFLRLRTGIAEQELDWEPRLAELLDLTGLSGVAEARDFLRDAPQLMKDYGNGDAFLRRSIASRLDSALREAVEALAIKVPIRYGGLILEDASAEASVRISIDEPLRKGFAELGQLVEITGALGWPRPEMATMRRVFDSQYGHDCASVPVLQFYRDFYRSHQKKHLIRSKRTRDDLDGVYDVANPLGLSIVHNIREAYRRVNSLVWSKCLRAPRGIEEVGVSLAELAGAVGQELLAEANARSATVFCEVLNDRLGTIVVDRGRSSIGYAKFWSRFMHLFDEGLAATVRKDNNRLEDVRLAEIYVDGSFNANLHPPLTRWEIEYPTVEARAGRGTIPLDRLVVSRHPDDEHRLELIDTSNGAGVAPVDLGFLHPTVRPQLFQLLSRFSPGRSVALVDPAKTALGDPTMDWSEVNPIPRVRIGDNIVAFRKRWLARGTALPVKDGSRSQFDYFRSLRSWRIAAGMPREVFVRLLAGPDRAAAGDDPDRASYHRPNAPGGFYANDAQKPQYVDFDAPGLVEVLGRLMGDAVRRNALAVFEERFPSEAPLRNGTGHDAGYVSELVLLIERSRGSQNG